MDISEIKKCKEIAEKAIETIIVEYERQTACNVTDIQVSTIGVELTQNGVYSKKQIKLEVKL